MRHPGSTFTSSTVNPWGSGISNGADSPGRTTIGIAYWDVPTPTTMPTAPVVSGILGDGEGSDSVAGTGMGAAPRYWTSPRTIPPDAATVSGSTWTPDPSTLAGSLGPVYPVTVASSPP